MPVLPTFCKHNTSPKTNGCCTVQNYGILTYVGDTSHHNNKGFKLYLTNPIERAGAVLTFHLSQHTVSDLKEFALAHALVFIGHPGKRE